MILWQLFSSFFKIGMFTIGGGYAMLTLIRAEILRYGWMSPAEFVDIVGIAEMTPGPLAVNAATFIGYRTAGITGSLLATTAVVLPSLITVLIVSRFWARYKSSKAVQGVFGGIRPVIAGLVAAAAVHVAVSTLQVVSPAVMQIPTLIIAFLSFLALHFKVDPIKILLISAVVGIIVF